MLWEEQGINIMLKKEVYYDDMIDINAGQPFYQYMHGRPEGGGSKGLFPSPWPALAGKKQYVSAPPPENFASLG